MLQFRPRVSLPVERDPCARARYGAGMIQAASPTHKRSAERFQRHAIFERSNTTIANILPPVLNTRSISHCTLLGHMRERQAIASNPGGGHPGPTPSTRQSSSRSRLLPAARYRISPRADASVGSSATALFRIPIPCPCTMRMRSTCASAALSRNLSTFSQASSARCPIRLISR